VARRVDEYEQGLQGIVTMTGRVDENLKRLQKESEFIDTVGRRLKEAVSRMGVLEKQIPELKHDFGKQNSAALKLVSQQVIKDVRGQAERLGKIAVVSEKKMKEYAGTIRDLDVRREEMFKESVTSIQTTFDEKFAEAEKAGEQILARFDSDLDHSIHVSDNNAQKLIDRIEDLHEELGRRINTSEEDLRSKLDTFQDQVNTLESQYQENLRNASKRGETLEDEIFTSLKDHVENRAREVEQVLSSELGEIRKNIEESREELNALFGETRSEITVWQATLQKRMENSQIEYDNRYTEFSRNIESNLISLADNTKANTGQQRDDLEKFINETRSGVIDFETSIRHRLDALDEKLQQKEDAFRELMKVSMKRETETAKTAVEQMNEAITAFEERVKERYQEVENKLGEYEGEVTYRFNRIDEVNLDIDRLEENLRNLMEQISENMKKDFVRFGKELNLLREEEKVSFEKDLTALHQSMDGLENGLVELKSRAYDNVSEKLRIFEDEFFSDIQERNDSMQEKLSAWQIEIDDRIISISESEEKRRVDLEKQYSENLSKRIEDFSLQSTRQQEVVEQHIQEYQDRLHGQVEEMQGSIESLKNNLFNEIEEIQGLSRESFERLFSEHQSTVESTLKRKSEIILKNPGKNSMPCLGRHVQK
jgi:chromosome segregation ATPase